MIPTLPPQEPLPNTESAAAHVKRMLLGNRQVCYPGYGYCRGKCECVCFFVVPRSVLDRYSYTDTSPQQPAYAVHATRAAAAPGIARGPRRFAALKDPARWEPCVAEMAVIRKAALAAWVAGLVARADNVAVTAAARQSAVNVA
jgi:hypothetical protein